MIVDLLVYPETADGELIEPNTLMEAATAAGLDGLVLVREGELSPDFTAFAEAGQAMGLAVFSGAELGTNHGLVLALLPDGASFEDVALVPNEDGIFDSASVIEAVNGKGGAVLALRPYDRDVDPPMGDHLFSLKGLAACEVRSALATDIANDLALEAASNLEMPCFGASGAQGAEGLGDAATLLRRSATTSEALIEMIKAGECWPVAFQDELPRDAREERRRSSRDRGDRRDGRDRRGGRGRGDGGGRRRRGGGGGRSGERRSSRSASAQDRSGPASDNLGNRHRTESGESSPPDDIGNRLRPGETSPFHDALRRGDD
ncbi:MAG: PHP-associated domain-containing protein [Myxococcota bacterium]